MLDIHATNELKFVPISIGRYFETAAFHADTQETRFYDADIERRVPFDSPWTINEIDADDKANEMHEKVVEELTEKLIKGFKL